MTTHFYMNYLTVQLGVEGLALVRIAQLVKFHMFQAIKGEQEAKELAEPEDQTSQGIGGRSARLTILLVIPIVFCTMCPIITIVAMLNFWLARMVYSYLFLFAETRKGDMGGEFWCTQLHHIQLSLLLFVLTMSGVLFERAPHPVCGWLSIASVALWFHMKQKYDRSYHWEALDFAEVCALEKEQEQSVAEQIAAAFYGRDDTHDHDPYQQEELAPPKPKEEPHHWSTLFTGGGRPAQETAVQGGTVQLSPFAGK